MYHLGDYKFVNKNEYLAAKRDMELICSLKTEGSDRREIYDSYLRQIREKGIVFESRAGRDFMDELQGSRGGTTGGSSRVYYVVSRRKRRIKLFLMTSLGLFFTIAALILIGWFYSDKTGRDSISRMQESVRASDENAYGEAPASEASSDNAEDDEFLQDAVSSDEAADTDNMEPDTVSARILGGYGIGSVRSKSDNKLALLEEDREILPQFEELYEENPDLAGWLTIPGTEIDYPVMYRAGDNDYYLGHDFNGRSDVNGLLVLDKRCDPEGYDPNWLIHGHNMRSGAMFGSLKNYTKESFYKEHKDITFSTLYEKKDYRIFAIFRSSVYDEGTSDFQYYDYISIEGQEEFDDYVLGAREQSLYDTGISPVYGDGLLTLSTCDYTKENGRLVVVACTFDGE